MARKLNEPLTIWSVEAISPGEKEWSTRLIEAHATSQSSDGALRLYNRGPRFNSPSRTVLHLGPGTWRSCEPVGTL